MGIFAGQIRRAGFTLAGDTIRHGRWTFSGDEPDHAAVSIWKGPCWCVYFILLKLALVWPWRCYFPAHHASAFDFVYGWPVYRRIIRNGDAHISKRHDFAALARCCEGFLMCCRTSKILDVMAAAAHGRAIPRALIAQNTAYAALYCAIVLAAAAAIFTRRNLK